MSVIRFKDAKVVKVGMVIRSINGVEMTITKILDLDRNEYTEYLMPQDTNMILEVDNSQYMWGEIPWVEMDGRVLVLNYDEYLEESSLS